MLKLENITKTYNLPDGSSVVALDDISLTIGPGKFIVIKGPSGCGKSTLLLTCGTLLCPSAGNVLLNNTNVYESTSDQRAILRAKHIGFVFQQFHLIPYLNLRDNIKAATLPCQCEQLDNRVDALMDKLDLTDRSGHVPASLSIGQCQRTALARALLNEPPFILADEPTGNLDDKNAAIVLKTLKSYTADGGSVIMVTHDLQSITHADEVHEMQNGKLS